MRTALRNANTNQKSRARSKRFGMVPQKTAYFVRGSLFERSAFTLVELLVVITIVLVLAGMTLSVWNTAASSDRVRSAGRQLQSAILGARDRAIFARENRGLRLVVDPNDPTVVKSMSYIKPAPDWSQGVIRLGYTDYQPNGIGDGNPDDVSNNGTVDTVTITSSNPAATPPFSTSAPFVYKEDEVNTVRGYGTGWKNLYDRGLLINGARIKIPNDATGSWYTVDTRRLSTNTGTAPEILTLTSVYRIGATIDFTTASTSGTYTNHAFPPNPTTYLLDLAPPLVPGQDPILLPSNMCIDLYNSNIPAAWYSELTIPSGGTVPTGYSVEAVNSTTGAQTVRQYIPNMDIIFSPRGTITGPLAAQGLIHFLLGASSDALVRRWPGHVDTAGNDDNDSDWAIVSLFPQTGSVASFPVNSDATGTKANFFYYANKGEVAGR